MAELTDGYGQLHADEASVFGLVVDEEGADTIDGAERVVHVEVLGSPGSTIEVSGSDEFRERVADDLDMLRSSPNGRLMLTELDQVRGGSDGAFGYSNDHVSIVELDEPNGRASNDQNAAEWLLGHDTYKIEYNPRFDDFRGGPSSVVLYHEMAHVYDYDNDTRLGGRYENPADPDTTPVFETDDFEIRGGVPNAERQAAGLPVDRDGDGTFEIDPEHPFEYTENGPRDEMRVPPRTTYGEPEPYGVVPTP